MVRVSLLIQVIPSGWERANSSTGNPSAGTDMEPVTAAAQGCKGVRRAGVRRAGFRLVR